MHVFRSYKYQDNYCVPKITKVWFKGSYRRKPHGQFFSETHGRVFRRTGEAEEKQGKSVF